MARKTNDDSSLSHTRWNCKCHIVFIPKYRRKEIYGKLRLDMRKIIRQLCEYKGSENSCKSDKNLAKENHHNLIKFRFFNNEFDLNPSFHFYDWLCINAVKDKYALYNALYKYKFFTDIEFNPQKSLNCQARSLTLYVWLVKNNRLNDYLNNPKKYYRDIESKF